MHIRQTIHLKLVAVVSIAALLVTCLSSWLVYLQSYRNTLAESERSVRQLMLIVQQTSAVAAFSGNRSIAVDVVNSLAHSDLVHYARITGQSQLDVSAGQRGDGSLRTLDLPAPFMPDEVAGRLEIEANTRLMYKRASVEALHAAAVLVGQAFFVALTVYLAVFRLLSRPLTQLSSLLHDIIPGSNRRLPKREIANEDELACLTSDINALLDMVQQMVEVERDVRDNLTLLEKRFRGMFENASIGIILIDELGSLRLANPAFYHLQQTAGLPTSGATEPGEWIPLLFQQPHRLWLLAEESKQRSQPMAEDLQTHHGWLHAIVAAARDDDNNLGYQCLFYDISERKAEEEAIRRLADFDHLTGVHNRQSGERILHRMVAQSEAARHGLAIMMIDLDRFKLINDNYGHDAGDIVLVEVTRRLRSAIRGDDLLSRLGGDEFMIALGGLRNHDFVFQLAEQLIQKVAMPICLKPDTYEYVGASIGIAFYPIHGDTANDLRCNADRAMYEVKRKGRNDFAIFSYEMSDIQAENAPPETEHR